MSASRVVAAFAAALTSACAPSGTPEAISTSEIRAVVACGPDVRSADEVITVRPSGAEDTANLQCALDAAIASGRRTTIQLAAGTFRIAQLVAHGFVGELRGAGADATVLTNVAGPLAVTAVDFFLEEPAPANPWPSLVAFVGGDFRVTDLGVRVTGEAPTTGWSIFGIDPPIRAVAHVFVIVGAEAEAAFERVEIEGAAAPDDLFGLNVANAILFQGFLGDLAPLAGRFEVRDSAFRTVASGTPVFNLRGARVAIQGNRFEDVPVAAELAPPLDDVDYAFTGNSVDAVQAALIAYQGDVAAVSLHVAGNDVRAFDGFEVFPAFGDDVACAIVGNDVTYDAENDGVAVWLGPRASGCLVATRGAVRDEGSGNRIVPPR